MEAASRGAVRVVLVEKCATAAAKIRRYVNELNAPAVVKTMQASCFLATTESSFDLIFLDPPFAAYQSDADWADLLVAVARRLRSGGRVYCESGSPFAPPSGWLAQTQKRAGAVHWQILRRQ